MKILPIMVLLFFVNLQLSFCPINKVIYIVENLPIIVKPISSTNWSPQSWLQWKEKMGLEESSGDWTKYNSKTHCIGKYQFQIATLKHLGYHGITFEEFKVNPNIFPLELQEEALISLIKKNEISLRKFEQYIGQTINDVKITRSGLLAAAHLGGVGGVKSFLIDNKNPQDINGTSIMDYLRKFQNYKI